MPMLDVEPWLRGTATEVPAVARAVLHALQLAEEDVNRWCSSLSDTELNARPNGIASVAFHIRHLARSVDRLLTYAEGRGLDEPQLSLLRTESDAGATRDQLFAELTASFADAAQRIRALSGPISNKRAPLARRIYPPRSADCSSMSQTIRSGTWDKSLLPRKLL